MAQPPATIGRPRTAITKYLSGRLGLSSAICDCLAMYRECTAAILAHQRVERDGRLWFVNVDFETGERLDWEQDELGSFYGGLLAQGGAISDGEACTRTWAAMQARFGVLPEMLDVATGSATQITNNLRPELADAAFNHWLLDGSEEWRRIARDHYLAMKRSSRAPFGYAALADVTAEPRVQRDHCPGYWWSEQMKYYYLMLADAPRFDCRRN